VRRLFLQLFLSERGAFAVIFILLVPLFLGMAGIGVDVGYWYETKRSLQIAADSAAVSGAYELVATSERDLATDSASQNASANFSGISAVNVSFPSDSLVEVVLEAPAELFFLKGFLAEPPLVEARGRAKIFRSSTDSDACITTLNPDSRNSFIVQGSAEVFAEGCSININSSSSEALNANGDAYNVQAKDVCLTGGSGRNSNLSNFHLTGQFKNPCGPIIDPLAGKLPDVDVSSCLENAEDVHLERIINRGLVTNRVGPGVHQGLHIADALSATVLLPGVHIFCHGLELKASALVRGTAVTIVLANSSQLIQAGTSILQVQANPFSSAGEFRDIVLMRAGDLLSPVTTKIAGTNQMIVQGIVYLPGHAVEFTGLASGGTRQPNTINLIADRVKFSGNNSFTFGMGTNGTNRRPDLFQGEEVVTVRLVQ
jgi:hypothetical protein